MMMLGTLDGMAFGVLVANLISPWLKIDVSAICACPGMPIGRWVSRAVRSADSPRVSLTC
jgi:hypothetical protein